MLSDKGNASHDGSTDAKSPVGVLVEAQDLAGEGKAEGANEEGKSREPSDFAGVFVSTEEENLRHVQEHDAHHEVRPPVVHGAQEPTELLVVGQILQSCVSLISGRHIDEREHDAGDELQHEAEERGAAEDIEPTAGTLRNMVTRGGFPDFFDMEAVIHPIENAEAEVGKFLDRNLHALGCARVGRAPARIMRLPLSILNS